VTGHANLFLKDFGSIQSTMLMTGLNQLDIDSFAMG